MADMRKPWLTPLARICMVLVVVCLIGGGAALFYVLKAPAEVAGTVAPLFGGRSMEVKQNKFVTQPLSWVALALLVVGMIAGGAREWAIRTRRILDTRLERMGIFPPPSPGLVRRLFRRG